MVFGTFTSMSPKRAYNWYICLVAAACMVLYGYDASVFNSVQGSKNWIAYFNNPNAATIGAINTSYTVGAIFGGFFLGGPTADYLGRKVGMGLGCVLVIISTFMQTFGPRHNLACFIAGRCIIGIGQGIALNLASYDKRMMLALILNAGQQITGQGSLNSYSTKVYQKVFTSDGQIALINALNATFGILFTLNAVWIIDRFGRKFLLIVGGIGMGLCMIIAASVETQTPTIAGGAKSESVGIAIAFLLFLFIFFYKPSWGATVWIWTSEVFSMNVRAQAVGMASQTQNVANAIFQQFFPIFLDNEGFYAFYLFAGINFLLAVFVFFLIPETKQVPLEEIDALFGGANHVAQGEEVLAQQKVVQGDEKPGVVTVENVGSK